MKLEHLIKAYKLNNINVEVKDMNTKEEKAGVINFDKGIAASYLLDDKETVVAMKMFFNCIATNKPKIQNQIEYVIEVINIIQKTIMLLSNIPQKECNMILEKLGLFNNTFQKRKENKAFRL